MGKWWMQAVVSNVQRINEDTEEGLDMAIAENLMKDKIKTLNNERIIDSVLVGEADTDDRNIIEVYVYNYNSITDWTFNRFETISDAVRDAVKNLHSTILFKGNPVVFDIINNEKAYYIDESNRMKIVSI